MTPGRPVTFVVKESLETMPIFGPVMRSRKPVTVGRENPREDMQKAFDQKVFLQLWVKVKEGWADDERALQSLGYRDDG